MSAAGQPPIPPVYRHPLGLPAGSVRAVLVLLVAGLFWMFLLLPADQYPPVPLYLHCLLPTVMLYFVTRNQPTDPRVPPQPGPWHLPRGFFRLLLLLGFLAAIGWQCYNSPEVLRDRLTPLKDDLDKWPYLLGTLGGSFLLGRLLRLGPWRRAAWFQDFLAWISLLAMIAIVVEICISLFVQPEFLKSLDRLVWECVLTGIVTMYFAARS